MLEGDEHSDQITSAQRLKTSKRTCASRRSAIVVEAARVRAHQAFAEVYVVEQPLAPGQCPRLTQQVGAHVATDQPIGTGSAPRQRTHDHPRTAANFEHALAGLDRKRVEQCAHDIDIARAAALLETGDAAVQCPAKGDRALMRRQRRDQRLPLAGRQIERQ